MRGFICTVIVAVAAWGGCAHGSSSDLAQYALQNVLQSGEEIFGETPSTNGTSIRTTWMSAYPDNTPLSSLNIPGLHDAATWNYSIATQAALESARKFANQSVLDPAVYRCQRASIADALEYGVRFFDLRYAMDVTDSYLVFWHNEALLSQRASLEDVLFGFYGWLEQHPSETVLLSLMYQGNTKQGASNNAAVQQELFRILTSPASQQYMLQQRGELGTLGEARGKALLLRRSDLDQLDEKYTAALPGLYLSPALWTDNSPDIELVYNDTTNATAYIEDFYEPSDLPPSANASVNIAAKLNATVTHLYKAAGTEHAESLFITFASGGHLASEPPVYPEIMALGNGTDVTPDGGVNQQLLSVLQSMKGKRLGVVVLDFWDEPGELVDLILGL